MLALVGHFGGFRNAFPRFRDNINHFNPKRPKTGEKRRFFKYSFGCKEHGRLCLAGHNAKPNILPEQNLDALPR